MDLGATPLSAFFKVVLPDLAPGITSGFLLAFTMSLDDFIITYFTRGAGINTLLIRNGSIAKIMETGATVRTAFCGPCFGAGDVPANNAFSIRHSTRNFPNREGSKVNNGQIASVALMDARSIAATALNKGRLTAATDIDVNFTKPKYYFDSHIYRTLRDKCPWPHGRAWTCRSQTRRQGRAFHPYKYREKCGRRPSAYRRKP